MAIVRKTSITSVEIDPKSIDNTIFVNEVTELIEDKTSEVLAQLDQNRVVLYSDTTDFPETRSQVKEIVQKYVGIWAEQFSL